MKEPLGFHAGSLGGALTEPVCVAAAPWGRHPEVRQWKRNQDLGARTSEEVEAAMVHLSGYLDMYFMNTDPEASLGATCLPTEFHIIPWSLTLEGL